MKFTLYEVSSLPVVVIDDFYDENSVEKIWREICFLSADNKLLDPDRTGSAKDITEENQVILKKKNKGLFLDDVYSMRHVSDILNENRKLFSSETVEKLVQTHALFRYLNICNIDHTLLSYYEDSDYYHAHVDEAMITTCTWFYKRPKKFEGGSIIFDDQLTVSCEFNRMVVFPSILFHTVEPVSIDEENRNKNLGRYTITQLLSRKS